MKVTAALKDLFTGPGSTARVAGAAMLAITVAAQHPNPAFNRVQVKDHFSFVPNWKFFAPNPATHDYHYLYRTLDFEGNTSNWHSVNIIADRKMHQAFWFATRRPEKAVFDVCTEILQQMNKGIDIVKEITGYKVLLQFIRREIREKHDAANVKGFQVSVVRASGHDADEEPMILFISPYTPMSAELDKPLIPLS